MSSSRTPPRRGKRQRLGKAQLMQNQGTEPGFQEPSGTHTKIAIPRIQQDHTTSGPREKRVKHACMVCQEQKAKCSGEQPQCRRCSELDLECTYSMGKRAADRLYVWFVPLIANHAKFEAFMND
jgi:hypothetical protein